MLYIVAFIVTPLLIVAIATAASMANTRAVDRAKAALQRKRDVHTLMKARPTKADENFEAMAVAAQTFKEFEEMTRGAEEAEDFETKASLTWTPRSVRKETPGGIFRAAASVSGNTYRSLAARSASAAPVAAAAISKSAAPSKRAAAALSSPKKSGRYDSSHEPLPSGSSFPNLLIASKLGETPDISAILRELQAAPIEVLRQSVLEEPVWRLALIQLATVGAEGANTARVLEAKLVALGKIAKTAE